jgi:hypothetical protein
MGPDLERLLNNRDCEIVQKKVHLSVVSHQAVWRPVQESNPCRRREREATYGNSIELRGMDSTLPHLKDSPERLLDL